MNPQTDTCIALFRKICVGEDTEVQEGSRKAEKGQDGNRTTADKSVEKRWG